MRGDAIRLLSASSEERVSTVAEVSVNTCVGDRAPISASNPMTSPGRYTSTIALRPSRKPRNWQAQPDRRRQIGLGEPTVGASNSLAPRIRGVELRNFAINSCRPRANSPRRPLKELDSITEDLLRRSSAGTIVLVNTTVA